MRFIRGPEKAQVRHTRKVRRYGAPCPDPLPYLMEFLRFRMKQQTLQNAGSNTAALPQLAPKHNKKLPKHQITYTMRATEPQNSNPPRTGRIVKTSARSKTKHAVLRPVLRRTSRSNTPWFNLTLTKGGNHRRVNRKGGRGEADTWRAVQLPRGCALCADVMTAAPRCVLPRKCEHSGMNCDILPSFVN